MLRIHLALGLYVAVLAAAFGGRTLLQRRRFGDGGWRFHRSPWRATVTHVSVVLALVLLLLAPVAAWAAGEPHEPLGPAVLGVSGRALAGPSLVGGLLLTLAGAALTLTAQRQMGASWRIGVDPAETTELVAGGLFRWARNPIFTGMAFVSVGLALLVPNVLAAGSVLLGAVGLQLQVRWIEEPYLTATHGDSYLQWASRVGRFVPRLGRLPVR